MDVRDLILDLAGAFPKGSGGKTPVWILTEDATVYDPVIVEWDEENQVVVVKVVESLDNN